MIDIEILSLQHRKNIYTKKYIYIYVYVQIDKHFRFNIFIYNKKTKKADKVKISIEEKGKKRIFKSDGKEIKWIVLL